MESLGVREIGQDAESSTAKMVSEKNVKCVRRVGAGNCRPRVLDTWRVAGCTGGRVASPTTLKAATFPNKGQEGQTIQGDNQRAGTRMYWCHRVTSVRHQRL